METVEQRLCMKTRVSLLNIEHVSVGEGYVSTMKVGDILHTRALLEYEVAVIVTKILDGRCAVQEPFLEVLEECMNTCIRWKTEHVVELATNAVEVGERNGHFGGHRFNVFEWTEEEGGIRSSDDGFIQQKKEQREVGKIPLHMESDRTVQKENAILRFNNIQVESEHGRGALEDPILQQKKRTYQKKKTRVPSKKPSLWKIGEDRVEKVSLQSVWKWITHTACVAQCLEAVSEIEILDVRYDIWMNCKSCDDRVTWILQQLRTFMEPNAATGWIDFNFRVDGRSICSACYAHVLGYSRRQLDHWKDDIRARNRKSACHGNALKPHETNHVAAARAILQKYIRGCRCIQPHRQHFRKRDGVFIPLVLLPMNTRKKDIRNLINQSL
jgi:hypothetical protein